MTSARIFLRPTVEFGKPRTTGIEATDLSSSLTVFVWTQLVSEVAGQLHVLMELMEQD